MKKTFSAGYRLTTNNRMELMAAIVALEALKEHYKWCHSTDSQYVRQDHPVDPQLEKARLETAEKTGKECRPLAAAGRRAWPA